VQTNCVFGLDFYKEFLPWQFTCRDFLYSSFLLQAREAAIAVQGKMVDLQRKKGKGVLLGFAAIFLGLCFG
jgi:hypothetical protein